MKKKIEDVEYEIIPIPPYLSPYSTRISELLKKTPQSVEDASEISGEIKEAMDKLFAETVTPKPERKHRTQVFNTINKLTMEVIEDAKFFRKPKRSRDGKSGATSAGNSQKT